MAADGRGETQQFAESDASQLPSSWQLFFRRMDGGYRGVMVVDVETDATFTRTQPRTLFESSTFGGSRPVISPNRK